MFLRLPRILGFISLNNIGVTVKPSCTAGQDKQNKRSLKEEAKRKINFNFISLDMFIIISDIIYWLPWRQELNKPKQNDYSHPQIPQVL